MADRIRCDNCHGLVVLEPSDITRPGEKWKMFTCCGNTWYISEKSWKRYKEAQEKYKARRK